MGCFKEMSIEEVNDAKIQKNYVAQKDSSFAHEPAPDIWFEILPFLGEKAEIPPELLSETLTDLQDR